MRTIAFIFALTLLVGCAPKAGVQPTPDFQAVTIADFKDLRLCEPIQEGALTLIPVSTSVPDDQMMDDYVTLAEAKKRGWIEVIELPDEANVDTLRVHYTGDKPLLLLAGELLLGGKQDRVIAKDTVIKPGDTVDVMVFCVEPGRWNGDSMHFEPQDSTVPMKTKEKAILEGQQEVWDSVGEYNAKASPNAEGTSLRYGYNNVTKSPEFGKSLDRAMRAIRGQKDVVGVVIVLGGRLYSFEYFGSARLFASSAESVVRGALASAVFEDKDTDLPPMKDVSDFVNRSLNSAKSASLQGRIATFDDESNQVAGGGAGLPSEDGKVLHGTFFDKSGK